jgi:hypothetical protein
MVFEGGIFKLRCDGLTTSASRISFTRLARSYFVLIESEANLEISHIRLQVSEICWCWPWWCLGNSVESSDLVGGLHANAYARLVASSAVVARLSSEWRVSSDIVGGRGYSSPKLRDMVLL